MTCFYGSKNKKALILYVDLQSADIQKKKKTPRGLLGNRVQTVEASVISSTQTEQSLLVISFSVLLKNTNTSSGSIKLTCFIKILTV